METIRFLKIDYMYDCLFDVRQNKTCRYILMFDFLKLRAVAMQIRILLIDYMYEKSVKIVLRHKNIKLNVEDIQLWEADPLILRVPFCQKCRNLFDMK